jgi:hypothetical protein
VIAERGTYDGIYQCRIAQLAPVDFSWADNGIPMSALEDKYGDGQYWVFKPDQVTDTGEGGYNGDYYWRQFTLSGYAGIWLSAWDYTSLIYHGGDTYPGFTPPAPPATPTVSTEAMIAWFVARQGKVTYSMTYRYGPSSYDCSSAVYYALREAGGSTSSIGSTVTLGADLVRNGFRLLNDGSTSVNTQRGDIFIWSDYPNPAQSGGAAGHTGIFTDADNIIHCNAGYNGITVNNHNLIWGYNNRPYFFIYRLDGQAGNPGNPGNPGERYGYTIAERKVEGGIDQCYIAQLVPVGFDWGDNGIPMSALEDKYGNGQHWQFKPDQVVDTGEAFVYEGYYIRKFLLSNYEVWLHAWSANDLIYYGGGNND